MSDLTEISDALKGYIYVKAQGVVESKPRVSRGDDDAWRIGFKLRVDDGSGVQRYGVRARALGDRGAELARDLSKGASVYVGGALRLARGRDLPQLGARRGVRLVDSDERYAAADAQGIISSLREEYGGFVWADMKCGDIAISALLGERMRRLIKRVREGETIRLSGALRAFDAFELEPERLLYERTLRTMTRRGS